MAGFLFLLTNLWPFFGLYAPGDVYLKKSKLNDRGGFVIAADQQLQRHKIFFSNLFRKPGPEKPSQTNANAYDTAKNFSQSRSPGIAHGERPRGDEICA